MELACAKKAALAAAVCLALSAADASAATITVTSGDDNFHSTTCNLRNAVASLRSGALQGSCTKSGDFGDNDTVAFSAALTDSTITLAHGEIVITGAITVAGSGQTINADYGSRVMYVGYHAVLTASNLTLTHGYAGGVRQDGAGAGIYLYRGTANLTNVTVSHNVAMGNGGGVNVYAGSLSLSHSVVSDNTAAGNVGGISVYSCDPSPCGATITDSVVSGNSGSQTGGIAVHSGYYSNPYGGSFITSFATITRSTISGNSAACSGSPCVGGIFSDTANSIAIAESTISGNDAAGNFDYVAGGLYLSFSALSIVNSTISGNTANGNNFVAGALWHNGTGYGAVTVTNSTISANTATTNNASVKVLSGVMLGYTNDSNMLLRNSIVAGNADGSDFGAIGVGETVTSCVVGTIASATRFNTDVTNIFTDTPGLGPLQNNGGPTQTMVLAADSIAIDAGNNAFAPSNYDQRGLPFGRVFNGKIDIGAVEFQTDRLFADGFETGP